MTNMASTVEVMKVAVLAISGDIQTLVQRPTANSDDIGSMVSERLFEKVRSELSPDFYAQISTSVSGRFKEVLEGVFTEVKSC